MADFDSKLPVRALAIDFTTEVANAAGTTINPVEEFPQGSTTSGQSGPLSQAAVTTAAPLYTTGQTAPLSLDVNGNLRTTATFIPSGTQDINIVSVGGNAVTTTIPVSGSVSVANFPATVAVTQSTSPWIVDGSGFTQPVSGTFWQATQPVSGTFWQATQPVSGTVTVVQPTGTSLHAVIDNFPATVVTPETVTYNTAAAIAPGVSSTQTYTPGADVYLDGVDASASGQMKIEIAIGAVTQTVMFTSKGSLQLMWRLVNPILVTSGTAVTIIRTNMDNQAMDVYSNVQVHS